jgi:hypothetical protein
MYRRRRGWILSLLAGVAALLMGYLGSTTPATAHWADLSVADITVAPTQTDITLTFPTGLVAFADTDRSGQLSAPEIQQHQTQLQSFFNERVQVTSTDQQPSQLSVAPSTALTNPIQQSGTPGQHSTLHLHYTWPQSVTGLKLSYTLFLPGVNTAQCLATIFADGQTRTVVLTPQQSTVALQATPWIQQIFSFLGLGIEHILTGYDHILFLLSLLMLGGGLPNLLKVVTAFTISHSITLSLAVLGVVSVPGRFVESAIALTIIYVAAENFWRKTTKGRWLLTFVFGLIHGFGFASILQEMNIPQSQMALALGSFNVGVEIGQLLAMSIMFVGLHLLHHKVAVKPLRYWISAGVAGMGLIWFIERTVGAF